jgi:hypothetical protein
MRSQARFDSVAFRIDAAGEQWISVSWNGHLHYSGDSYASYSLRIQLADRYDFPYDTLIESDFVNSGTENNKFISESRVFAVNIQVEDIGTTAYLSALLMASAGMEYGGISTDGAYADFYHSFVVTGWSGGLQSLDGVTPVPLPATMLLFGSGSAGLAAFRKRFKKRLRPGRRRM